MFRLIALLITLAAPAVAQTVLPPPALKAKALVTSDIVRIGDLVENAGVVADIPIFRAPDLGTTGAVATARVVDAIRPHELIGIDTRGLSEVLVTRASRAIGTAEVEAALTRVLSGQGGLGEPRNIAVRLDRELRTVQIEPSATGELHAQRLYYDPRNGHFDVTFDVPGSAILSRQPLRLTGSATELADVVTVNRPVERGELLKASDLARERRPKTDATGKLILDPNAALGLAVRYGLRPGQVLREADLMKPELVQRNESVTIIYQAPGVLISIRGKTQDSGALGDVVSVLNVQSKRIVQGTVTGPGQVTVTPETARFVEAAPDNASRALASSADPNGRRAQ